MLPSLRQHLIGIFVTVRTYYKFRVLRKQTQLAALLRANNSDNACPSDVRSVVEEVSDAAIVEEVDKEKWNFDRVVTAVEVEESGLCGKFREKLTEFRAVYTEM